MNFSDEKLLIASAKFHSENNFSNFLQKCLTNSSRVRKLCQTQIRLRKIQLLGLAVDPKLQIKLSFQAVLVSLKTWRLTFFFIFQHFIKPFSELLFPFVWFTASAYFRSRSLFCATPTSSSFAPTRWRFMQRVDRISGFNLCCNLFSFSSFDELLQRRRFNWKCKTTIKFR